MKIKKISKCVCDPSTSGSVSAALSEYWGFLPVVRAAPG